MKGEKNPDISPYSNYHNNASIPSQCTCTSQKRGQNKTHCLQDENSICRPAPHDKMSFPIKPHTKTAERVHSQPWGVESEDKKEQNKKKRTCRTCLAFPEGNNTQPTTSCARTLNLVAEIKGVAAANNNNSTLPCNTTQLSTFKQTSLALPLHVVRVKGERRRAMTLSGWGGRVERGWGIDPPGPFSLFSGYIINTLFFV